MSLEALLLFFITTQILQVRASYVPRSAPLGL
jgi:hypothetical protein